MVWWPGRGSIPPAELGGIFLMMASAMYGAEEPSQRKTFSKDEILYMSFMPLFEEVNFFFLSF